MSRERDSILDLIAQDARVLRTARMLPDNRPLTPDEIAQVARDFRSWIKESRRSIASVARALGAGYSESVLSQFSNALYRGDCEKIARSVNQYIELNTIRGEVEKPKDFVETEVATDILTVARIACTSNGMGVVVGPSGVGKSKCIEALARIYPGAIAIRVMSSTRRAPGLIRDLAAKLGVPMRNTAALAQRGIIETLKGTGRPIFIDEAHQLIDTGLDAVRDIHDEAEVPIVLFGTKTLNDRIIDTQQYFGQFNSRVVARRDVTEAAMRPRNPRPLFTVDEVIKVCAGGKVKLTKDAGDFLTEIACVPGLGGLRIASQIVAIARRLMKGRDSIDGEMVRRVFRQMHGDAYQQLVTARQQSFRPRMAAAG